MKPFVIACMATVLAVTLSCSKQDMAAVPDPVPTDTIPPAVPGNGLIRKMVTTGAGSDTIVQTYYYNADNLLDRSFFVVHNYRSGTLVLDSASTQCKWDNQKRMTQYSQKSSDQPEAEHTFYYYTGSNLQMSHSIRSYSNKQGDLFYDSMLFVYNADGRMSKIQPYYSLNLAAEPVKKSDTYQLLEYDVSGNLVMQEFHTTLAIAPGIDTVVVHFNYTYDNKINPLIPAGFSNYPEVSHNNRITQHAITPRFGTGGSTETFQQVNYTYDSKDRPATAEMFDLSTPSQISKSVYFYYD